MIKKNSALSLGKSLIVLIRNSFFLDIKKSYLWTLLNFISRISKNSNREDFLIVFTLVI